MKYILKVILLWAVCFWLGWSLGIIVLRIQTNYCPNTVNSPVVQDFLYFDFRQK